MDDYLWVLKDAERDLVRELEPQRIEKLTEDELLALHKRVRRARNKHVTNYRRRAGKAVSEAGARGAAAPKGAKSRLRAEAFEEALAIVSGHLAAVAHEEAELLKAQRLAQAQANRSTGPSSVGADTAASGNAGIARSHSKTTGGQKRDASTKGQGKQRQAKRDSR